MFRIDDFKARFRNEEQKNNQRKQDTFLAGIERQSQIINGTYKDELVPGDVTLEHIFPKSPSAYWMKQAGNDLKSAKEMTFKLGNMCLLTDVNRALGNRSWDEKKPYFGKSRLNITNGLMKYAKWQRSDIDDRQKHMADLATQAWRYP